MNKFLVKFFYNADMLFMYGAQNETYNGGKDVKW